MSRRMVLALLTVAAGALGFSAASAFAESCPNEQLRAENNSSALPDCRAYELVSPVDKDGINVGNEPPAQSLPVSQSTESGERVAYSAVGAFAGAASASLINYYQATLGSAGWETEPVDPPRIAPHGLDSSPAVVGISSDGSHALVRTMAALAPGAIAGNANFYVEDLATGSETLVATSNDPEFGNFGISVTWLGGSPDLSRVVFQVNARLTSDAAPSGAPNIYEWEEGVLRLLNVLPDDSVSPEGGFAAYGSFGQGSYALRSPASDTSVPPTGHRVFFTAEDAAQSGSTQQLFMRVDGTSTVWISKSQSSTPSPEGIQDALFGAANDDGSRVFFVSRQKLTDKSSAFGNENSGSSDLYEYDADTGGLNDLTVTSDPAGAQVESVLGTSTDGSYIYFSARGVLAAGAVEGNLNIYVVHEGEIATALSEPPGGSVRDESLYQISPSGRYLERLTNARLTAYDNYERAEVYVHDVLSGTTVCTSCRVDGQPPTGEASMLSSEIGTISRHDPRSMLDSGVVVFQSTEPLVPADQNGRQDVYEYEDGQVHLLSGGRGSSENYLADVSADGSEVFFITRDRLVEEDQDDLADLYVARVDGGFPALDQAHGSGQSCGDGCQGAPTPPPAFGTPATTSVSGPGNISAPAPLATPKSVVKAKRKSLTRAQKLASALKQCKKKSKQLKRHSCEAQARKSYGSTSTKSNRRSK